MLSALNLFANTIAIIAIIKDTKDIAKTIKFARSDPIKKNTLTVEINAIPPKNNPVNPNPKAKFLLEIHPWYISTACCEHLANCAFPAAAVTPASDVFCTLTIQLQ